jgi:AcrR family transcriptional regulator
MARPRSAGFDDQREQILVAAAQLFATRGYTATTMNEVATACGVSKATLYHYVADKHGLLVQISAGHVAKLEALVLTVAAQALPPAAHMQALILRFMQVYAGAQQEHRVLTEDVKFLDVADRRKVLAAQRRVVAAFADAVAALRPDLRAAKLDKAVAMLLFGMMNWTFTWLKASGALTHESLAPLVANLFIGGLPSLHLPPGGASKAKPAAQSTGHR